MFPLFPIFVIFLIGAVAETNRAPFDLAEAESELVSGFMTEHAAVIFVFFFLAEYASIVLICILISILFIGGYLLNIPYIHTLLLMDYLNSSEASPMSETIITPLLEGIFSSIIIGVKTCIMVFVFI
jgi:NADH-ubiquinone oxidoreductase chain 1